MEGREIQKGPYSNGKINVHKLSAGVYFVRILGEGPSQVLKLLIE
jgi:hypothetical protein